MKNQIKKLIIFKENFKKNRNYLNKILKKSIKLKSNLKKPKVKIKNFDN